MANTNIVQYHGVGRRKKSIARVFLRPGTGNIEVNGKNFGRISSIGNIAYGC